ncbi:MAG TPA: RibD family protein [Solirubrobacteraceae bacterium]|jgi:diaminohydroxyphosphoribosylaminopyrimidine deaminase/5-amino-6-(5-phosphoribosylamino)uracil reductase|nr:RibD family protein [Solirubrobacteraceae bacterium]
MNAVVQDRRSDAATSSCWRALQLLAEFMRCHTGDVRSCSMLIGDEPRACVGPAPHAGGDGFAVTVTFGAADDLPPPAPGESRYRFDDLIVLERIVDGDLPAAAAAMLELYLPYCLAPVHARRLGRAFSVSHFAQSLDGRIATRVGDARWIGCEENRLHAHRMRALCDGILIGAHTLRIDRPALTVRHAEGEDPVRIVVGDADDITCLEQAGPGAIVLIGDDRGPSSAQVVRVVLPRIDGRISTSAILEALYRAGILSVYIEGGATTTSTFLAEGNIDVLQLHISPLIIGPGVNSFTRPSIQSVQDSVRFEPHVYRSIGDGMMFVGRVAQ